MYQEGNQEAMLGEFFKDKPRDSYVIATKVIPPGLTDFMTGEIGEEFSVEAYLEMFETSLKRLQMDYVDIFYQHVVATEDAVLRDDLLGAMQKMKDQGKARCIGVSTHYNQGMGYIGMKALAGNYLAEEKSKPVDPVAALKWVLQDPSICTIIPGYTAYDQIETDVEVMYDIDLTPDEEAELEEGRKLTGLFCQGCGTCKGTCTNNLPVPDLMRAYMYAYGYADIEKARGVLDTRNIDSNPCKGCSSCTVSCARNFPVHDRIEKIARLKNVPKDFIV